jgi:hypothetical protein
MSETKVSDPPELAPEEKEVTIRFARDQEAYRIHSEIGSVTRKLINHPDFSEDSRSTTDGVVVSVSGTLPLGTLSVKSKARQSNNISQVISQAVMQE